MSPPRITARARLPALLVLPFLTVLHAAEPARTQSQIKGLLVVQLGSGDLAGTASQMNATVVPGREGTFSIGFNQKVGAMMDSATIEVEKFLRVRHGDQLPLGHRVELAFSDKYSPKDGPSAAVVCALLADSIITGREIDPHFAATGDMTATGEVRPVGGITGKVRGAAKKDCRIIGIPLPNQSAIEDLYIIEGIAPLHEIQILTIETFEEAQALASTKRRDDLQTALDEFALVQKALSRNEKYILNSQVRAKLKKIVQLAPNHLSARLLFLHGIRQGPKALSLTGSLTAIDKASQKFGQMLESLAFLDTGHDDVLRDFISEMMRLRPMLDARTRAYADTYEELADYLKSIRGRNNLSAQMQRELQTLVRKVDVERRKLLDDREIREELMLD